MSIIHIEDIAHVRFSAPDLDAMARFLRDFGLICFEADGRLYGHGRDAAPYLHVTELGKPAFRALGLRAESVADLQRLAERTGTLVEPLHTPGGGHVVRLHDPDDNLVEVVAGQAPRTAEPAPDEAPFNAASSRRRLRSPVRLQPGAAHVQRLGHAVLNVRDFERSERWYKERFGFITSHEIEAAPGASIGAFLRVNRGATPTDHHTLFLLQLPAPGPPLNHAAFEVAGLDDLMLGHSHLRARGRQLAWGVGRHKLGSQIFDYWKDPWGNELEHWTDGDLFTAADGSEKASLRELLEVQWGAVFPKLAGRHAPSPETIAKAVALMLRLQRWFRTPNKGAAT
ncbi:MAG: VOC family protein [Polyangiales bacterium]